jgi:hypothetical protein
MTCTWFELLNRVIPIAAWRLRLCGWHVDRCPRCRPASAGDDTLASILVTAEQLPPSLDLWAGVRKGIEGEPLAAAAPAAARPAPQRLTYWAYAAAMVTALFIAGFGILFLQPPRGKRPATVAVHPAAQTRLCAASIENRPARVFLIQSRNPDRVIFWIARDDQRS